MLCRLDNSLFALQKRGVMKKYFVSFQKVRIFAVAKMTKGRLAEGLGTGLQNLLLRFKSGSDLNERRQHKTLSSLALY